MTKFKNEKIKLQHKYIFMKNLSVVLFLLIVGILGGNLNLLAASENGGKMPVLSKYSYSTSTHFTFQDSSEVTYFYLADIFKINDFIYSIGDFLIYISCFSTVILMSFFLKRILAFYWIPKYRDCRI